jgi:hypothetical protein
MSYTEEIRLKGSIMFFRNAAKCILEKNNLLSRYSTKPFQMKWLSKPDVPQRVLFYGEQKDLMAFQNNLKSENIPSAFCPKSNGKSQLEVWFNNIVFTKKMDDIADKTIKELGSASNSLSMKRTP